MENPKPFLDQLRARTARLPAIYVLVAANIAVFLAMLVAGAGLWHGPNSIQLAWGANFGPATKDGEWWRLFTAMFLHFGLFHLAVNMVALVEAGRFVERSLGSVRFLLLYCGGGLAGNLLSLAFQGDHGISGGASGAVFAVFGALLSILWGERDALDPREFRWLFGGTAILAGANILLGSFVAGIDNAAHVGGFGFGLLAALALDRGVLAQRHLPAHARGVAAAVLVAMLGILVVYLPAPAYRWSDELAARNEIGRFLGADADISTRWQGIIEQGSRSKQSFEDLAVRIESDVTERYETSFEQLSTVHLDPRAPSAQTLDKLKNYAVARRDAAQMVVDALRAKDLEKFRRGLTLAQEAARNNAATAEPKNKR